MNATPSVPSKPTALPTQLPSRPITSTTEMNKAPTHLASRPRPGFDFDPAQLESGLHEAAGLLREFYAGLEERRVSPDAPAAEIERAFERTLGEEGVGLDGALAHVREHVLPHAMTIPHPTYMGLINSSPLPGGIVAESIIGGLNNNAGSRQQAAPFVAAENEVVRCFAELPAGRGSLETTGAARAAAPSGSRCVPSARAALERGRKTPIGARSRDEIRHRTRLAAILVPDRAPPTPDTPELLHAEPAWSTYPRSERGGRIGASLFSLIATCKALDVNPERYLEDVILQVDTLPASEIHRLTPWAWAAEN